MDKPPEIYYPPSDQAIEHLAQQFCERAAVQTSDPTMANREVIDGLAGFLKLIARLQAKHLNRQFSNK